MVRWVALMMVGMLTGGLFPGGKAAAAAAAPEWRLPVRLSSGLVFAVPFGWHWTSIENGVRVTFAPGEERREGPPDPSAFTLVSLSRPPSRDILGGDWPRIDRQGERSLPTGARVRWRAGQRWHIHPGNYNFVAELRMGEKVLEVSLEKWNVPPGFSLARIEEALEQIGMFISVVPESGMIFHPDPDRPMAAVKLDGWWNSNVSAKNFNYACAPKACGGAFHIYVYPSSKTFPDVSAALADITGYFEKNRSLRIGPVQRENFGAGELAWSEQPGSPFPFLAAVRRDGRYYFAQGAGDGGSPPNVKARADFFAVLRSVQGWNGR